MLIAYAPVVTKVTSHSIYVVSSDCLKYFDLKTTTRHLVLGFKRIFVFV